MMNDTYIIMIHYDPLNTNEWMPPNAKPGNIYKPSHMFITSSSLIFR